MRILLKIIRLGIQLYKNMLDPSSHIRAHSVRIQAIFAACLKNVPMINSELLCKKLIVLYVDLLIEMFTV